MTWRRAARRARPRVGAPTGSGWARHLAVALIAAAGAVFVVLNRDELPAAISAVRHASPAWLLVAGLLCIAWMLDLAAMHFWAQRALGCVPRYNAVLRASAAAVFLNTIAKSGGLAGLAAFLTRVRDPVRRGQVTAAYVLATLLTNAAFAVTLAAALVVIVLDGRVTRADLIAAVVFGLYTLGTAAGVVAALRSRAALRRLYRLPGWVRARLPLRSHNGHRTAEDSDQHADELFAALTLARRHPRALLPAAGCAMAVEVLGIALLAAVLASLGHGQRPGVALVAYAVSVLFGIVGVLPAGLGFVEVSLGAVLVSFGVPAAGAAVAVVLYRVYELWLPLLVGAIAARSLAPSWPR